VHISSAGQFNSLLQSSTIVVTDCRHSQPPTPPLGKHPALTFEKLLADSSSTVYADWCGPCKIIAPIYEQLSAQLSRPNKITFAKVNTDQQKEIAQTYSVSASVTTLFGTVCKSLSAVLAVPSGNSLDGVAAGTALEGIEAVDLRT